MLIISAEATFEPTCIKVDIMSLTNLVGEWQHAIREDRNIIKGSSIILGKGKNCKKSSLTL